MLCPSDHSVMGGHAVSYFRRHRGKTRRRAEDRNWTRLTQSGRRTTLLKFNFFQVGYSRDVLKPSKFLA